MSTAEADSGTRESSEYPLAALYQRSVLDPIVEVAFMISHDFVERPLHYRAVPAKVAGILENFRIRTGSDPKWPSTAQRDEVFEPLFGDAFTTTGNALRAASVAFAESAARSLETLQDSVRDTCTAFRAYLKSIDGRVVSLADTQTQPVFHNAVEVFRSEAVTGAFGLLPPGRSWPLDTDSESPDGTVLIEEIQRALGLFHDRPTLTQHVFILLQRVARYGSLTVAGVLDDSSDWDDSDQLHALIRNACGWDTALRAVLTEMKRTDRPLEPRKVSPLAFDDEELRSLPTEEDARRYSAQFAQQQQPPVVTCTYGWTIRCDSGPTCISGWTQVCDSGPTCTYGWTFRCDKPRASF